MSRHLTPICIDFGTTGVRLGYAGKETPLFSIESVVGIPQSKASRGNSVKRDVFVGKDALNNSDNLILTNLFNPTQPFNKIDVTSFLTQIFEKYADIIPLHHSFVLQEPVISSERERSTLCEIFFETFTAPSLFIGSAPFFGLHTSGKVNGIVIEVGDSLTEVSSFYERFAIPESKTQTTIAGNSVTEFLRKSLKDKCYHFLDARGNSISRQIKEAHCFISSGEPCEPVTYKINEEDSVEICEERYKCPEILFNPSVGQLGAKGIGKIAEESIRRSDSSVRDLLLENVVLVGGTSQMKGIQERMHRVLSEKLGRDVQVPDMPRKGNGVWVGESIFGSLDLFDDMTLSIDEYKEVGMAAASQRFFN